ncbi:MAG: hypothetical protein HOH74_25020, partial [Gemmatimonadetes bacterium]|nr:hypothetical protein [Gemmatimonadota bacterium]
MVPLSNGILITPTLANVSTEDLCVQSVEIIHMDGPDSPLRFLRFGFNMPGDVVRFGTMDREGVTPPPLPVDGQACTETASHHILTSNSLFAFASMDRRQITLIGNSTFDVSEGTVELCCSKLRESTELTYRACLDGVVLPGGSSKTLDPVIILTGDDLNDLLEQWADYAAAQTAPRIPEAIPTGWNDWQYYRNEKTQQDVLDSASVLAQMRQQGYPLDFVQVDGGFCMHLSEWSLPRPSFSDGIEDLAVRVTGMGLKFGLWLAPYIQNVQTHVVKQHPEWLLLDDEGSVIQLPGSNVGPSCLIDYSAEGALEWLRDLVRLFVHDWRVTWIKLDGPNYARYRDGVLRDPSLTVTQMLARSFDVIREAAGADVLVEGEGMMGVALGRVDLHRVQADNHPKWYAGNRRDTPYAPLVYGKELIMSFLHNRWWCNHRENVILRNDPSELVAAQVHGDGGVEQAFTEPEFRTQLVAAVMGSGGLLLTDPMRDLQRHEERFAWISRLLP